MRIFWGRDVTRIKVYYTIQGLTKAYESYKEAGKEQVFFDEYASPSFQCYIDNRRKAEREKFRELASSLIPMNTFIPNLGYKVKHRFSDDIVYVLDMGSWQDRARREIDPARERLSIYLTENKTSGTFAWYISQGDTASALRNAPHWANERYVDRLTKKQREAIMFIRMLPEDEYVKGIGAWVRSRYQDGKTYIIDC
jgi:hypothetical protein